jgi:hypothetical protein
MSSFTFNTIFEDKSYPYASQIFKITCHSIVLTCLFFPFSYKCKVNHVNGVVWQQNIQIETSIRDICLKL